MGPPYTDYFIAFNTFRRQIFKLKKQKPMGCKEPTLGVEFDLKQAFLFSSGQENCRANEKSVAIALFS
jgi:hypothetical protein